MSMVQAILYTFWGIALYPATDAPYWKKGYIAMIVILLATTWVVHLVSEPHPAGVLVDALGID
jgi:hypothetical protein